MTFSQSDSQSEPQSRHLYFAYGSNMDRGKLARNIPSAQVVGCACLVGWRIRFNKLGRDGMARATLQPAADRKVWGVLYYLSEPDWQKLDKLEALGRGYDCVAVRVKSTEGEHEAHTYVGLRHARGLKLPAWYRESVLKGAREAGLPKKYLERLHRTLEKKSGN